MVVDQWNRLEIVYRRWFLLASRREMKCLMVMGMKMDFVPAKSGKIVELHLYNFSILNLGYRLTNENHPELAFPT